MRAARALVLATLVLVACRPRGDAKTSEPDATPARDATPKDKPSQPPIPEHCAGGEHWNGNPDTCDYAHEACCYPDPQALCAAAGCAPERCQILESHPAQARCEP